MKITKNKQARTAAVIDAVAIVFGSALTALGLVCFTLPNNIAPGGVSGLATAIAHVLPVPVGITTLVLNIPIFIIAWKVLGFRPLIKTAVATVLLSVLIDAFSALPIQYTGNTLLAAMLGGGLMGIGLGALFTRNITTGGTDLLSMVLKRKRPYMSMGSLLMLLDSVVVAVAVLAFGEIEIALYSVVAIFCVSKVTDAIIQGVDYAKVVYIITENGEDIVRELTQELGRGVTQVFARGGYTGRDKMMIMTVARRTELSAIQKTVKRYDDSAFVIYLDATEVHGEGFKSLAD